MKLAPTTAPEEVLKVSEVAAHLRVDPETVYRLIHSERLRSIRLGRVIRVPLSALSDFISESPR
ncbi:MAG: helix-turn-helix domain-containing protein [bacterium]|nr:helix-turn-helix domain-containing protein [bacterium]